MHLDTTINSRFNCDPDVIWSQKTHSCWCQNVWFHPSVVFFPLSNFSDLASSPSLFLISPQLGRTQLKACSGLLHHPILSSHLISRLWRHWHTARVPLPDIFIRGGLSWNGNSEPPLVSARGATAGTPLALLGRLPCPGKPRHGDGGSGSQPEELSCGRALAPTTRRIPAPSCESNWHSVGW